jgi:hypothetical protein
MVNEGPQSFWLAALPFSVMLAFGEINELKRKEMKPHNRIFFIK